MEEKILDIINNNYDPDWEELGLRKSAKEIADIFRRFTEWLMLVTTQEFFPQTSDGGNTEYFDYYGRIKEKDDLITLDDLFNYWYENVKDK